MIRLMPDAIHEFPYGPACVGLGCNRIHAALSCEDIDTERSEASALRC
jgi:hypothetical protein